MRDQERVYDSIDGRGSKSYHREEHSPLRSKRRSTGRKKSSHRSTGRLHTSERIHNASERLHNGSRVHGNRHVGGCCAGHGLHEKPHPHHQRSRSPTERKRKKKQSFLSPSRKYAKINEEREEEFRNYKGLVEQRFTQMLEDEKCKLK